MKEFLNQTNYSERDRSLDYAADQMKMMRGTGEIEAPKSLFVGFETETRMRLKSICDLNDEAVRLSLIHNDVSKLLEKRDVLNFTEDDLKRLFNSEFLLATSKLLNDLCEVYVDQDGQKRLRYKERFYKVAVNEDKADDDGFAVDEFGNRVEVKEANQGIKKGKYGIDSEVLKKITRPSDYKEELASFLAAENGRKEPNYIDKMNACAVCDFVYVMGDSSFWDRNSVLAPYKGLINCPIRSLNLKNRALKQWGIEKSSADTYDSCYLGGPFNEYIAEVLHVEEKTGRSVDGNERIKERLASGDLNIFNYRLMLGFYDIASNNYGSLGELLMRYAYDQNGVKLPEDQRKFDFDFGEDAVGIMNKFRNSLELSVLTSRCLRGQIQEEKKIDWLNKFKWRLSDIGEIKSVDGVSIFSYPANPEFWRDLFVGLFGYNRDRLSKNCVCLRKPLIVVNDSVSRRYDLDKNEERYVDMSYSSYVFGLIKQVGLDHFFVDDKQFDFYKLLRGLGIEIKEGEDPESLKVIMRNNHKDREERNRTYKLRDEVRRKSFL